MTAETDRAAALKAAIQDIARDLEADLGKHTRHRGTATPSVAVSFRDPGPNLTSYGAQKDANWAGVGKTLDSYRVLTVQARGFVAGVSSAAARAELIDLLGSVDDVRNHSDAAALVATFEVA